MSTATRLASLCTFQRHRQHRLAPRHGEELTVRVRQLHVNHVDDIVPHRKPLVMQGFDRSSTPARILQRQFAQQGMFLVTDQARLHEIAIDERQTCRGFVVGTGGGGRVGGTIQLVKPPVEVTREVDHVLARRLPFFHHHGIVKRHHVRLDGPFHSVLRPPRLIGRDSLVKHVTTQIVDARRRLSHQLKVFGHGQIQSERGWRGIAVRGLHLHQLSKGIHIHGQHLVVEGFTPLVVPSSVSDHFPRLIMFAGQGDTRPEFHPRQIVDGHASKHTTHGHGFVGLVVDVLRVRRGILVVKDAHAVDEERVAVFHTQIPHFGDGAIGRRQRDHGHLPLFFGVETNGFLQANREIRVGVVVKFARGIADQGNAYLVHFSRTRSFLLIQLSYLAGQPFQRTRIVSFLRFTTESMRNRSSSETMTFWTSSS